MLRIWDLSAAVVGGWVSLKPGISRLWRRAFRKNEPEEHDPSIVLSEHTVFEHFA